MNLFEKQIEIEEISFFEKVDKNTVLLEKTKIDNTVGFQFLFNKCLIDFEPILEQFKKKNSNEFIKKLDNKIFINFFLSNILKGEIEDLSLIKVYKNVYKDILNNMNYNEYKKTDKVYFNLIKDKKHKMGKLYTLNSMTNLFRKNRNFEKQNVFEEKDFNELVRMCMKCIYQTNIFKINILKVYKNYKTLMKTNITLDKELFEKIDEINMLNTLKDFYYLPMVSKPISWKEGERGGYYTNYPSYTLLKESRKLNENILNENYKNKDLLNCLNVLQNTKYKINEFILNEFSFILNEVGGGVCDIPLVNGYKLPENVVVEDEENLTEQEKLEIKENRRKIAYIRQYNERMKQKVLSYKLIEKIALEFKQYENIYFVYNYDFRGRVYTLQSYLTTQGLEVAKAMLDLQGKKIGNDIKTINNLKVHIVNSYGNDKCTIEEAISWFDKNEEMILKCGEEPRLNKEWYYTDKPFSFLRGCKEWYDYKKSGYSPDFITTMICYIDGKCNGTQHMSAMALDKETAELVCVIGDKPRDLYQEFLNILKEELKKGESDLEKEIFEKVDRKMVKRNVMTTSYSATVAGFKQQILDELKDRNNKLGPNKRFFKNGDYFVAEFLSKKNMELMKKVLKSTVLVQEFLKECVSIYFKLGCGNSIKFSNNVGFVVQQNYFKEEKIKVKTYLKTFKVKRKKTHTYTSYFKETDEVNLIESKNGISPNFTHSQDSGHLVRVVNRIGKDISVVHDSFGTYCCDIENLKNVLKEEFVNIYKEDVLLKFRNDLINSCSNDKKKLLKEKLPTFERFHTFKIEEVLDSVYFFR